MVGSLQCRDPLLHEPNLPRRILLLGLHHPGGFSVLATGLGVWHFQHAVFLANTFVLHCGHVQSNASLKVPSVDRGAVGASAVRPALHSKHFVLLQKLMVRHLRQNPVRIKN